MQDPEDEPFNSKAKRMGMLYRLTIDDPQKLDRIEMAGVGDVLAPMLLSLSWGTIAGAYKVGAVVPLEEYYTNETRGFEPTYEEYKDAVLGAIEDMNDHAPLRNGESIIYADSTCGWHARACAWVAKSANLPVISIESNPGIKLAIVETIRSPKKGR